MYQNRLFSFSHGLIAVSDSVSVEVSELVSGCIGVIEYWLFGGMKQSKEEMARWTGTILLEGIRKVAGVTEKGREQRSAVESKIRRVLLLSFQKRDFLVQ